METPLELWGITDHKIDAFRIETAFKNFLDSAVICHFYPYEYHHMEDALNGAGGWNLDKDEINRSESKSLISVVYIWYEKVLPIRMTHFQPGHFSDWIPARLQANR